MKKKDTLRDIYQSDTPDFEKDFTPQVAQEIVEQRQRDLRRSRLIATFFGVLAILVAVVVIAVVIREVLGTQDEEAPVLVEDTSYIPRHTLPSEAAWVINYKEQPDSPVDELGEKPLSAQWVKKAAYHIIMGQQALSINEQEEALNHLLDVVDIYPEIEGVRRAIGMLYIQKEDYAKAAENLELALKEEESFDVVNNLGTAYIGTEDYESAEKYLTRALELLPESPICQKNLAVLYRKMDLPDKAVFHFEKYLDLSPDDTETMQTYALYLTKLGRWADAADFLEKLTENVTDVAPIYFLLAQVQVQNGQQDKAVEALQRGIQLVDPSLALAWMSRDEFRTVRGTKDFQALVDQLEIATVSLDEVK
jgi:tetratricopeptide (TPR) repeat protein